MNIEQLMFIGMSIILSIGVRLIGDWLSFMIAFGFIIGIGTIHIHLARIEQAK